MLPKKAMKKVQKGKTCVERYRLVTIFFSDIAGYTTMSSNMSPIQVMKMLNQFYCEVDKIAEKYNIYKIEVIGDAYMCVVGCPEACLAPEGAERMALFALDMIELVKNFRMDDGSKIFVRAGIHSGPVVGGVVGSKRPQWTIFGDTVNTASRMESTSQKMRIQCSDLTYRLLQDAPNHTFTFTDRGHVEAKGKGKMHAWFIDGAKSRAQVAPFTLDNLEKHHNPPLSLDNLEKHDNGVEVEQDNTEFDNSNELQENVEDACSIDSMSPMER